MSRIIFVCCIIYSLNLKAGFQDNLFPTLDNWKINIDKHSYEIIDLWGFLGDKAEIYNTNGFQSLQIAEYSNKQNNLIKVELFKFNSINGAYGVYTSERNPKYISNELGIESIYMDGNFIFSAGDYLVKISDIGQQPAGLENLKNVGIHIIQTIAPANKMPEALDLFPDDSKIKYSDKVIPENFLGYHFLGTAFTVRYDSIFPCILFIVEAKTNEEAAEMLDGYLSLLKEDKVLKEGEYDLIDDFFNGKLIISKQSKFLIGAMTYTDKIQTINKLEVIRKRIKQNYPGNE